MVKAGTTLATARTANPSVPSSPITSSSATSPSTNDRYRCLAHPGVRKRRLCHRAARRNLGDDADYRRFLKQSENWRNLFDPSTGWIRPRHAMEPGSPDSTPSARFPKPRLAGIQRINLALRKATPGNTLFMIPFDYPTLFAAIGGDDKVIPRLDKFFLKLRCWGEPCYNIENEPDFVVPTPTPLPANLGRPSIVSRASHRKPSSPHPTAFPATTTSAQPPASMSGTPSASIPPYPASEVSCWVRLCSTK
jgi:hypothetical protein